jgi:nitrite reductase/ring-hydroxylating ferredoxin subunit
VGVNHALEEGPREWTEAAPEEEFAAGGPVVADVGGNPVLFTRSDDGRVVAIGARCTHAGGPLGEGKFEGGCVECPWHASVFRLDDGEVVHGPATVPQPAYETSRADGHISVRRA